MSQNQAVRAQQDITAGVLFMAFELSSSVWLLAFGDHTRRKPRMISIQAGDLGRVSQEIEKAKRAFRLQSDAPVFSCYEAGRDGFWLHRALLSLEVENIVVDSASIEINRRKRRPKSDRLDAAKLLEQLQRFHLFNVDQKVWSVVVVPSEEIEDERQLHREIDQLTKMCTRHSNRIKSLLATQGLRIKSDKHFLERLAAARLWNGNPLGSDLRVRLEREYERLRRCDREKYGLQQEAVRRMKEGETAVAQTATKLQLLKGVGAWSGWKIAMELFGWRVFANRRQVAGAAGLAPSHYLSGLGGSDQGISKEGNARIRALMIELAWLWLRYQPDSDLSHWFFQKFPQGKRNRRVGIVAVARRLLIALWKFVEFDELMEGAELKSKPKVVPVAAT